jgi:hypothetical protein
MFWQAQQTEAADLRDIAKTEAMRVIAPTMDKLFSVEDLRNRDRLSFEYAQLYFMASEVLTSGLTLTSTKEAMELRHQKVLQILAQAAEWANASVDAHIARQNQQQ